MIDRLATNLPTASLGLLALLGAIVLIGSGIALIVLGMRASRDRLVQRVDAIRGPGGEADAARSETKRPQDAIQIRLQSQGSARQEQWEAIRLFGRLGIAPARALAVFVAVRLIAAAALGIAVLLLILDYSPLGDSVLLLAGLTGGGGVAGWFLPTALIRMRVKQRLRAIENGLPDALELLVVCVEAGISLEDGIDRIVTELWHTLPALAEELALTSADLKILPSRDQALGNLADRVDIPSIRSIVTTLSQTLRYGTPLVHALRVVASEMRSDALMRMEERANRLPALMTLPMMLFILPTIFLVLGGPAALRVIDTLPN